MTISRREFIGLATASTAGFALGCTEPGIDPIPFATGGRLHSRYKAPTTDGQPGLQPLGLGSSRDGRLFIPRLGAARQPVPLLLLFHGAGASSAMWFGSYVARAEHASVALLAPDSRGATWDLFTAYGPDVAFIDGALASVFDRCPIDPARVYVAGFSDGASYALSLGLTNGDLFSRVIAYSPGLLGGVDPHGRPKLMVAHGVRDTVLPIDDTSRRIVPMLRNAGYDTSYGEFDGGHLVPPEVSDTAFAWLAGG